ncbi:MAG: cytochrome c biogenesis protein CcsA [Ktedonobacterales bacterium]|nr:cytochrome c biogenesis protein CcsA [Ktedonobacterales bacterium]
MRNLSHNRAPTAALQRTRAARARWRSVWVPSAQTALARWRQALAPSAQAALRPVRRYGEYALGGATAITMLVAVWAALAYAPIDATQGLAWRIFYFHVPGAWVAYLAFSVVFGASILYLWRKDARWDWLAHGAAEIGTVFTTLTLISGSLWGRPIWGAWWTWDPRLTTTLILEFIFIGYLLLRTYLGRGASGARAAAVVGILGFVDVPINYLSTTWWRTQHPSLMVTTDNAGHLTGPALFALFISLAAFTLLFGFLLLQAYRLERLQTMAHRLRARVASDDYLD